MFYNLLMFDEDNNLQLTNIKILCFTILFAKKTND